MLITYPGNPMYDIASTTTAFIAPLEPYIAFSVGLFVAFFVLQFLIDLLANKLWPPTPPAFHAPMM